MDENEVVELLDKLADFQAMKDVLALDKQKLVDTVLTDEIKAKLAEIDAEFSEKAQAVDANAALVEAQVKTLVAGIGKSVKGKYLHAVLSKGRVSWDTKKLEGLMMIVPNLAEARSEGNPSVSIRKIG